MFPSVAGPAATRDRRARRRCLGLLAGPSQELDLVGDDLVAGAPLAALIALRGRARLAAARALEELCELGGQQRSAAVLERWLVDRAQASAASDADLT